MTALLSVTTTKPIYYAGDRLEGSIHIVTEEVVPAKSLTLEILGEQSCNYPGLFCFGAFSNKRITYREKIVIKRFYLPIKHGHYSYPFKIELPYNIPATFTIDRDNSIQFLLIGKLDGVDGVEYRYPLEVREPDRRVKQRKIQNLIAIYPKYWLCCFSYQSQTVGLELSQVNNQRIEAWDAEELTDGAQGTKAGDTLQLIGSVDNSRGEAPFQGLEVILSEQFFLFSENRLSCGQIIKEHTLHKFEAFPGMKKTRFKVNVQIPMVKSYTAIGNIIIRLFFLKIEKKCSWTKEQKYLKEHLILNNDDVPRQVKSKLPKDFRPIIGKIVDCREISQYQFKPRFRLNHNQGIRPDRARSVPSWIPSNPSNNDSQSEQIQQKDSEPKQTLPSAQVLYRDNL